MDMESYFELSHLLLLSPSFTIYCEYISLSLAIILYHFNADGISHEYSTVFGMLSIFNQGKQ